MCKFVALFVNRAVFGVGLLAAGASAPLAVAQNAAQKPPPPPATIPVSSIVHDQDTAVPPNQLLFRGDDPNGNFQATYTNTGNVTTWVGNPGGWRLNLYNQVARTVCLTFSTVDGSTPVVPDGCYSANVEIYSRCHDLSNNEIGFLTIQVGTPATNCTFGFDFYSPRTKYKLEMGQSLQSTPPSPNTGGWATVTCNSASGGACNSWTIVPNAGAANFTIANLYHFGTGKSGLAYIGQYYLTYRIDATNP